MHPLSRTTLLAYGLPALPLAVMILPVQIFLPTFYAGDLGLGLTTVGWILAVSRLWDAVSDPLIGWLSDRIPPRYGRRRVPILIGTPLVMVSAWMVMIPGDEVTGGYLLFWTILLYTGWTAVILPINAWGAELSSDYDERSRIAAWREGFALVGTLVALLLPFLIGIDGRSDAGGALALLGWLVVTVLPLTIVLMIWRVPDTVPEVRSPTAPQPGLKAMLGNRPFRRLIGSYFVNSIANALPATLFLLYVGNMLGTPEAAGAMLLAYFVAGVAAVPLWSRLANRFGKHPVWCWAMIWACVWFAVVPFLGPGDVFGFLVISLATGLALGADLILPSAMQADVIDVDTARTGRNRAGLYFAAWGLATKAALAVAVGVAFPILGWVGFQDGSENSQLSLWVLVALYAGLPVILKALAVVSMWKFPITSATLEEVQQEMRTAPDTVAPR